MGRLQGKSVIITGAGSGIGRAASLLFTREGAKLIAVDRTEAVKESVEEVEKAPGCAMFFFLGEKEEYFDNKDHGLKAYERARGPKKLVTIPSITHYGIYGVARPRLSRRRFVRPGPSRANPRGRLPRVSFHQGASA